MILIMCGSLSLCFFPLANAVAGSFAAQCSFSRAKLKRVRCMRSLSYADVFIWYITSAVRRQHPQTVNRQRIVQYMLSESMGNIYRSRATGVGIA